MKNPTTIFVRFSMAFALLTLFASASLAQVGINRDPVNTTLKVGNDTLAPSDTVLSVLDETDQVLLQVERIGRVRMPKLDTGGLGSKFLTQAANGTIEVRELNPNVLAEDWIVTPSLIHDLDSHIVIRRGANAEASIEVNKPGVFGAGESFFKAGITHAPNDYVTIASSTSANNYLYPTLKGHVEGAGYALLLMGETDAAHDTGSLAMVRFEARRPQSRIFNRPLFQWISYQATWMTMTADGWLGLGTATPSAQLEITGDAVKPGGGSWTGASDRRLKKNIREFKDGLDVLMQINPVWFEYNGKANMPADKTYAGIIAQEMQKIAPYTVGSFDFEGKDGNVESYLKYDGNATTYILINSIQEQQAIIDAQSNRIDRLEASMNAMQEKFEAINQRFEADSSTPEIAKR